MRLVTTGINQNCSDSWNELGYVAHWGLLIAFYSQQILDERTESKMNEAEGDQVWQCKDVTCLFALSVER